MDMKANTSKTAIAPLKLTEKNGAVIMMSN